MLIHWVSHPVYYWLSVADHGLNCPDGALHTPAAYVTDPNLLRYHAA